MEANAGGCNARTACPTFSSFPWRGHQWSTPVGAAEDAWTKLTFGIPIHLYSVHMCTYAAVTLPVTSITLMLHVGCTMAASVKQRIAFGERAGQHVRRIGSGFGYEGERPALTGPRCASVNGFSLHAHTQVPVHRRDQLERLIRYTARGAVSPISFLDAPARPVRFQPHSLAGEERKVAEGNSFFFRA